MRLKLLENWNSQDLCLYTGCPNKRGICFTVHSIWNLDYPFLIYLNIEIHMFVPSTKLFLSDIRELRNTFSSIKFV